MAAPGQPQVGRVEDTVPPMPHANPNIPQSPFIATKEDLLAFQHEMANRAAELRDAVTRIEGATKTLSSVAPSNTTKLSRNEKLVVAGAALGMVGIGVGGTLAVQAIRRRGAARRMTVTTTK